MRAHHTALQEHILSSEREGEPASQRARKRERKREREREGERERGRERERDREIAGRGIQQNGFKQYHIYEHIT